MANTQALNSRELIDLIAERISRNSDWRDGFSELLNHISSRLATPTCFIRLYHYISNHYLDLVSTHSDENNLVVDAVFRQLAEDRTPVALPAEYADYLVDGPQYSVVGIPFIKNDEYLGGLVLAGNNGAGVRASHFHELLAISPYLIPLFESAVLQEILLSNYLEAVETLAVALEAKDFYTRGHSNMVTAYAVAIARKMNLGPRMIQAVEVGAMMHDIGKIGVPDEILKKPGGLTREEFEIVMRHPVIGEEILKPMKHPLFDIPRQIVRWHHERLDGKGYPDGLQGDEIPFPARITFVADAYDAMTSERPYRAGMPMELAFAELRKNAGTQFEPEIVEILYNLMMPTAGEISAAGASGKGEKKK
ncbi:MAG: HD-GYP domain-containing protein [bacterium]|nr:HD-GYP domain-containing protein [bacterium]